MDKIIKKLTESTPYVSINDGIATCVNGEQIDLKNVAIPRLLTTVSGGVAHVLSDSGSIDVRIFDFDDYESDPESCDAIPGHWADLARGIDGLPFKFEIGNANPFAAEMIAELSKVEGIVSFGNGTAFTEDGREFPLADAKPVRVLVTVSGGVAEVVSDSKYVQTCVFDADNYEEDKIATVPASWADMLPVFTDIPLMEALEPTSKRSALKM